MRSLALVLAVLAVPSLTTAQITNPSPELGIRGGYLHFDGEGDGDGFSVFAVPGTTSGFLGVNTVYLTIFPGPRWAVEPQLGIIRVSDADDDATTLISFGGQLMGFLSDDATRSPYAFIHGSVNRISDGDDSDSSNALGAGLGYRTVVRNSLGLRFEARYRRLRNEGFSTNELGLLVGFGAVIGR